MYNIFNRNTPDYKQDEENDGSELVRGVTFPKSDGGKKNQYNKKQGNNIVDYVKRPVLIDTVFVNVGKKTELDVNDSGDTKCGNKDGYDNVKGILKLACTVF